LRVLPALIALIYLILCVRVRICTVLSLSGSCGCLMVSASAIGMALRFDAEIRRGNTEIFPAFRPRYGKAAREKKQGHEKALRRFRRYLWFARTGRMEHLGFEARIGLGDAGKTALACGCLRAVASSFILRFGRGAVCDLRIAPDFSHTCFSAYASCTFSCQMGNILLAALKKNRKEGIKRKSSS